jgi:hypothetical protein
MRPVEAAVRAIASWRQDTDGPRTGRCRNTVPEAADALTPGQPQDPADEMVTVRRAGDRLDDGSEQRVAGVGVVVGTTRRTLRRQPVDRGQRVLPAQRLMIFAVGAGEAAGVQQQMPQPQVGNRRGEHRQMLTYPVVQRQVAALSQVQHGSSGHRLGHRADAEHRVPAVAHPATRVGQPKAVGAPLICRRHRERPAEADPLPRGKRFTDVAAHQRQIELSLPRPIAVDGEGPGGQHHQDADSRDKTDNRTTHDKQHRGPRANPP